jgi:Mn2+/Fe2+ NRAMP family transporter
VIGEFNGIAGSLELFHVSKFISIPICSALVWLLVVRGDYKSVEKIFLVASVFYFTYIIAGVLAHPGWHAATAATLRIPSLSVLRNKDYVFTVVALIGTTIAPWMQFYLQSSIVEKGVTPSTYGASRLDVIIGSIFTDVVAWFIIVACAATLWVHGVTNIQDASDAAAAMKPLAGQYAFVLFAFGLFNAGFFAASVLPLSTAYVVCEGLGVESGLDKRFREAPFFYGLYTVLIFGGAVAVMITPNATLMRWYTESQAFNGILLPVVIVLMLLLINRKDLMREYVNPRWFNAAAWLTAIVVSILSIILMVQQWWPGQH